MNRLWLAMMLAGMCTTPLMAQMGEKEEPEEPEFNVEEYAAELIKNSDTDKDGKVTLDEVIKKFKDFNKAIHAAGEDEEKLAKVYETYSYPIGSYYFGTADANGDKAVTKEELVAAIKAMYGETEVKLTLTQCEAMATIEFYEMSYDKNDDGSISKEEADESWEYLVDYDTDKDGKISKDEYFKARLAALKTAYGLEGSTDPKSDPKADPKSDPKADPKSDPKADPKGSGDTELKKELFTLYTKQGRTWMMKSTSKVGDMEMVTYMKYEVVSVGEEEAEIKFTMLDKDKKDMGMPASTQKISFRVAKPTSGAAPTTTAASTSEEKIKVGAGEFECIKTTIEVAGNKTTSWTSKKFAGLLVKSETTGQATAIMELVEFNE